MAQQLKLEEVMDLEPGFCLIYEIGTRGQKGHQVAEVKALRVDRDVLIEIVEMVVSDPDDPLLEKDRHWVPIEQLRKEPI